MKNNITELVFIIDKSGSMAGLESDTVGGFNSLIAKQKKETGECYVSTVLFSNESEVIHDREKLSDIKEMSVDDYTVGGCTALIDALGGAIKHIKTIHKYARPEDIPSNTLFVITTDGLENASCRYDSGTVKRMIEEQKEKCGWEFLFIGANIDAISTAKKLGINRDRAVNYYADSSGTEAVYGAVCCAASAVRKSRSLSSDWCAEIEDDFNSRCLSSE